MESAGAIIRVSTKTQLGGTSPEKQLEAIGALAAAQGFAIRDDAAWLLAESGSLRERVGFREALAAVEAGHVSRVYVFNIDRLGRNLLEMLLFLRDLEDMGAECWDAEKQRRLLWNDFLFQIEGAVASKERQEILKRTQDGLRRSIAKGQYSGGIIAYGYRLNPDTKQLEIEEEEAQWVRLVFQWTIEERLSTGKIADRLNGLGVPTRYEKNGILLRQRGKRSREKTKGVWTYGRVLSMLRNPAYMGEWEYGKKSSKRQPEARIKGFCPAIVTPEVFHQAGNIVHGNMLFSKRNAKREYLLRGLIKCMHCEHTFVGSYHIKQRATARTEHCYYQCNGQRMARRLHLPRCDAKWLPAEQIEPVIWEDIKAFVKNPELAIRQLRVQQPATEASVATQIAECNRQLADLRRQESNLLIIAAKSLQVDIASLDETLEPIRRQQRQLTEYRGRLERGRFEAAARERELRAAAGRLAALWDRIDAATVAEKRRAVEELVKGVDVETQILNGKRTQIITVTYRFNEPGLGEVEKWPTGITIGTDAHAATMETIHSLVRVPSRQFSVINNGFQVPFWIALTFIWRWEGCLFKNWQGWNRGRIQQRCGCG